MRDDEIGVAEVNVRCQRRQKQPRQSADREQADEPKAIKHRRVIRDRSFVKRRRPVENFNRRWDRDRET